MTNLLYRDEIRTKAQPRAAVTGYPLSLLGGLSASFALVIYLATLAPDLTWNHNGYDGGELITAAVTLGLPHPPGYPTYVLLGKLVSLIPVGTVAFRFNLFSACSMAVACGLLAMSIGRLLAGDSQEIAHATAQRTERKNVATFASLREPIDAKSSLAAVAAALAFAFTPLVWGQAIISEVYALNLAMLAGFLWAMVGRRAYRLTGLLLGLSITTHLTSLFFLPLALFFIPRPFWRRAAVGLLFGLAPLAAIPLLAQSNSPVMWGRPVDLAGWWWLVSGQLYHNNLRFPPDIQHVQQVSAALLSSFVWLGLPLLWGLLRRVLGGHGLQSASDTESALKRTGQRLRLTGFNRFPIAAGGFNRQHRRHELKSAEQRPYPSKFLYLSAATIGIFVVYALIYHTADAPVLLLPVLLLLAIVAAPFLRLAGAAALLLPLAVLIIHYPTMDSSQEQQVRPLAEQLLAAAPNDAILLTPGDRTIFSLWYFHHVEGQRSDLLLVDSNLFAFFWYRQRLQDQYPSLRGLAADDLPAFRAANEGQRPICQVNLVESSTSLPGISCDEQSAIGK